MECLTPIIFRPLKPPEPTRPGARAPGITRHQRHAHHELYFKPLGRDDDTTQDEWDTLNDMLRDHVEDLDYGRLADRYVQMHDSSTIGAVLYPCDGVEYLDGECTMPWKQDRYGAP